jgi:hypothetical protein
MKKLVIILGAITVSLSACLKDKPNVDFSQIGTFVELPYSGVANFSRDAITAAGDTIVTAFTANIDSDYPPKSDTKVTVGVDNAFIAKYTAQDNTVAYDPMPDGSYVLNVTSVTIKGGSRLANFSVTFYKNMLDPSKSYMLPVKIVSADQPISGNFNVHYFHFIGNDFAGDYLHDYTRIPAAGNYVGQANGSFAPDSPTQLEAFASGYYTANIRFRINFVKTGAGPTAMYSKFTVVLNPDDVAGILTPAGLAVGDAAKFVGPDPSASYTYDQVVHGVFKLHWTTTSGRDITDYFYKP